MSIIFDMSHLTKAITEAQAKSGNRLSKEDYTKTSYLPEGQHAVGIFIDPEDHLFREVVYHKPEGSKVKCHCPNYLNKSNLKNPNWAKQVQDMAPEFKEQKLNALPPCEICAVDQEAKQIDVDKYGDVKKGKSWKKKFAAQYNHLVYMNLYRTNAPGQYWEPNADKGTPYAVIGTSKLKKSILALVESLTQTSGTYITRAVNPSIATPPFTISSTRGAQGQINISASPEDAKPVIVESKDNAPTWWRPLRQVFLSEDFNLEDYDANVKAAKDMLETFKEEESGKPNVPPTVVEDSQDQKKSTNGPIQLNTIVNELKQANVSLDKLDIRPTIETPAPLTVEEKEKEQTGELKANQRISVTGEIVELPDYAVERDCWKNFDSLDPLCLKCPVALECMVSQE